MQGPKVAVRSFKGPGSTAVVRAVVCLSIGRKVYSTLESLIFLRHGLTPLDHTKIEHARYRSEIRRWHQRNGMLSEAVSFTTELPLTAHGYVYDQRSWNNQQLLQITEKGEGVVMQSVHATMSTSRILYVYTPMMTVHGSCLSSRGQSTSSLNPCCRKRRRW